jgi:hypothetical protein
MQDERTTEARHQLQLLVLLGIAAYRAGEKLFWDTENLKITNNPQAECFIRRDKYRKGWTL